MNLGHRLTHRPTQMSGGEQQRVAIARALVGEPRILLADEPTGNLDSRNGAEVMRILEELNSERGVAVVLVTHDDEVAGRARRQVGCATASSSTTRRRARWGSVKGWEAFRVALDALRGNRVRSLLTMLGIIIGIAAVIVVVSIGSGARQQIESQVEGLGSNLILVVPGQFDTNNLGNNAAATSTMQIKDGQVLATSSATRAPSRPA